MYILKMTFFTLWSLVELGAVCILVDIGSHAASLSNRYNSFEEWSGL